MLNLYLPEIETENLILRPVRESDARDMYEYASDYDNTFFLTFPLHKSVKESQMVIRDIFLTYPEKGLPQAYAIIHKQDKRMIGMCDFHRIAYEDIGEIGYVINKKYWNNGYTTEACKKMIEIGFEYIGLRRIEIAHSVDNLASERVIEKCGFVFEGIKKDYVKDRSGKYSDHKIYAILRKDYLKNKGEI